jgi:putative membrane protein
MMWWDHDWGWGGWLMMTLAMVAFWGFVAWVVVTLVRPPGQHDSRPDAEAILAERFARGEIDQEDFAKRRAALRSKG